MNTVQQAKMKVAVIFTALSAHPNTIWNEMVRGGWDAQSSITGGILTAHVGEDGEYAVYAGKGETRLITLASGTFAKSTSNMTSYSTNQESAAAEKRSAHSENGTPLEKRL